VTGSSLASVEPIGTIQTWEGDSSYPDETPFVSDLGWVKQRAERVPGWFRGVAVDSTPLLTPVEAYAPGDEMGRLWRPWAFYPSASPHFVVSSVGMGVMAAGIVLTTSLGGLLGTSVLPARGVFRLMNPGQVIVETTALRDEIDEIRMLAPGLLPRTLRVREIADPFPTSEPPAREALDAIADIGLWLGRSQKDVAQLCGFSLRASRYWGSGKTSSPRPSTVRHLYEVHSFLGSLVRSMGKSAARDWFALPTETGELRLDVLAQEGGMRVLLREASSILFSEVPKAEHAVPESVARAETDLDAAPYAPADRRPVQRRARRAPRHRE
jgi:hypothetical protein